MHLPGTPPASGRSLAAAFVLASLAGCGGEATAARPNVLLIVLDTVRADHLGCYGGPRVTPTLDALAAAATRYERCTASSPWTVPSHASLFTGLDPHTHGAQSFEVDAFEGLDNVYALPEDRVTLAELLRDEGYATGGVVANAAYLKPAFGLSQGFEDWSVSRVRAPRLNREALAWIDARAPGEPWFLFLNYMDAHRPYNVEPIAGEDEIPQRESSVILLDELFEAVVVRGEEPGDLARRVREQYTRAVRNLDRALGELIAGLRERGLWEETILVVTSDHGEYFGEHGLVEHSKDVYEPALDVPLIVKPAGVSSGRVLAEHASNAHVPRLVIDAIGGDVAARCAPQFPRSPGATVVAENRYSRLRDILHPEVGARFRRVRSAYYEGDLKLVRSSDGAHELYRLDRDPAEALDLAASEPAEVARLLTALESLFAATPYTGGLRESVGGEAHLRDLQGTGYAGSDD